MGTLILVLVVMGVLVLIGWAISEQEKVEDIKRAHERLQELAKLETAGLLTTEEKAEGTELIKRFREFNKKHANPVDRRIMEHEEKKKWERQKQDLIASLEAEEIQRKNFLAEFKNMSELVKTRPLTEDEAIHCIAIVTQLKKLNIKYLDEEQKKNMEEVTDAFIKSLNLNKDKSIVENKDKLVGELVTK